MRNWKTRKATNGADTEPGVCAGIVAPVGGGRESKDDPVHYENQVEVINAFWLMVTESMRHFVLGQNRSQLYL